MKKTWLISLILVLAALGLSACGGGGGGGGVVPVDPNAPAAVSMTPSKTMALADGNDAVTILAQVVKSNGTPVADGTIVAFSTPTSGAAFSASSAPTASGIATTSLTLAPLTGVSNRSVTVNCSVGNASNTTQLTFINQPTSVDVAISFDQAVTNLAALQFVLNNQAGASFNNLPLQVPLGSLAAANFDAASNSTTIGLTNASGFNTGTAPVIVITFSVAPGAGLPAFSIDQAAGFIATDPLSGPTVPPVTAANLVVTRTFDTEP